MAKIPVTLIASKSKTSLSLTGTIDIFILQTYSGLFCVSVNPYAYFPIYTERVVRMFQVTIRTNPEQKC
jgi:hypothetical protein